MRLRVDVARCASAAAPRPGSSRRRRTGGRRTPRAPEALRGEVDGQRHRIAAGRRAGVDARRASLRARRRRHVARRSRRTCGPCASTWCASRSKACARRPRVDRDQLLDVAVRRRRDARTTSAMPSPRAACSTRGARELTQRRRVRDDALLDRRLESAGEREAADRRTSNRRTAASAQRRGASTPSGRLTRSSRRPCARPVSRVDSST